MNSPKKFGDLFKDKEFRQNILSVIGEINKQIEINSNLINLNLEHLNWNKNPYIKKAAERLGIFENSAMINELLHINTLNFDLELEEMLENVGLLQKPKSPRIEELNEFLRSNPITIKKIITNTVSSEDDLEISSLFNFNSVKYPYFLL